MFTKNNSCDSPHLNTLGRDMPWHVPHPPLPQESLEKDSCVLITPPIIRAIRPIPLPQESLEKDSCVLITPPISFVQFV